MKRIVAGRPSPRCGPVKTSPLGMLRRPLELIQVRPSTRSAGRCPRPRSGSRAPRVSRSISRAWNARQLAPGGHRVGAVEEQRARRRTPRSSSSLMPACWASAGVGQSVPHQRLRQPQPPGSARGRGRRGRSVAGSTSASAACCRARRCAGTRRPARTSARSEGRERVELRVGRERVEVLVRRRAARSRSSGHASRSRIARGARGSAARRAGGDARAPDAPRLDLEAPVAEQRRRTPVGTSITAPGAPGSARRRARAACRGSNRALVGDGHPVARRAAPSGA